MKNKSTRKKITVARLLNIGFIKDELQGRTIYRKGRFFIYPDYDVWYYGLDYGSPEHGTLSHVTYMDELIRIMGELSEENL